MACRSPPPSGTSPPSSPRARRVIAPGVADCSAGPCSGEPRPPRTGAAPGRVSRASRAARSHCSLGRGACA
eukprot:569657-Prymnesium_polylepis.1